MAGVAVGGSVSCRSREKRALLSQKTASAGLMPDIGRILRKILRTDPPIRRD
jgi:hypothetical protein